MESFALEDFVGAAQRIKPYCRRTKLIELPGGLLLKAEHHQETGSFKLRGALNKVLGLEGMADRAVVCASAGNHGLGVARACYLKKFQCTVVVPADAPKVKVTAIRAEGADVIFADGDYGSAERKGRALAQSTDAFWVSPYNDRQVILGQGTIGLEIAEQMGPRIGQEFDLFVPASGGGLLCGVGLAIKGMTDHCRVIGVQTTAAPYLYTFFNKGSWKEVQEKPTLADGLAGPIEQSSITLELLREACDEFCTVTEEGIQRAMRELMGQGEVVEPSAAVAYAAAAEQGTDRTKVVLLTGKNVDESTLKEVITG